MIYIMKNVSKILFKRKSFILTSFIFPLIMVLLLTALNGSATTYKVGLINKDNGEFGVALEERLEEIDFVKIIMLENDENYNEKLMFHEFEILITIDEDFTEQILNGEFSRIDIKSIGQTDMEPTMIGILESEVKALATICNNVNVEEVGIDKVLKTFNESKPNYEIKTFEKNKVGIIASLGSIFYFIFIAAGMSCSFILEDEKQGTKDRTLMGRVSENQYYSGLCAVFFALTSIIAVEYFIICNVFKYEFGFENKILLLMLLLLFVLFAVVFSIMIASIVKKKSVYMLVNTCFVLPMFMLSGCFWPFEAMSEGIQKAASILPPRWIFMAVERLQAGEGVISIIPMIIAFVALIVVLFLLSIFFTRSKIILVKDE